jgi:GntR family transcriptional repressor for pyruvate dehydrogenase complex
MPPITPRPALEVMEQPDVDEERFNDADTAFHVALADVSANRLASDLTIAIRESMRQPILSALRSQQVWQEVADQQRAEHRAMLTAVEERDADRAERLVEEHIRTAWARLRQPS